MRVGGLGGHEPHISDLRTPLFAKLTSEPHISGSEPHIAALNPTPLAPNPTKNGSIDVFNTKKRFFLSKQLCHVEEIYKYFNKKVTTVNIFVFYTTNLLLHILT